MCCKKASCLLLVTKVRSSRVGPPPPLAVPKGGLLSITSLRGRLLPALARVLPRCTTPWSSPSMPCSRQFISARRRVLVTSSMPMKAWLRWNWRSRSVRS